MKDWLLVFIGMAALDFVWARYTKTLAACNSVGAANWSVAIILLSGFVTKSYVENPWLLSAAAVGAWVGTFASNWKTAP